MILAQISDLYIGLHFVVTTRTISLFAESTNVSSLMGSFQQADREESDYIPKANFQDSNHFAIIVDRVVLKLIKSVK